MNNFTEATFEQALIETLQALDYEYANGVDLREQPGFTDYSQFILENRLTNALFKINPKTHPAAVEEAINKIKRLSNPSMNERNFEFHQLLTKSVSVNYYDGNKSTSTQLQLIDTQNPLNNDFLVVNQLSFNEGDKTCRPDVIIYINGLPLVLFELKSPSREEADLMSAYTQIQNYKTIIPTLFNYNAICIISDMITAKAGTITSNYSRFAAWKKTNDVESPIKDTRMQYATLIDGMMPKERLIDIIMNYIFVVNEPNNAYKALAGYHQYFAAKSAAESVRKAILSDHRGGIVWHSTGSGKSFTMAMLAKNLMNDNPTIVVLTDRNDLDDQLFDTFYYTNEYIGQKPKQASSRIDLIEHLKDRQAGGIIFSTVQKFSESSEALSTRQDIILIVDEAHRSHYENTVKYDRAGNAIYGIAYHIAQALPNATKIGFTGTPIEASDRDTRAVFGNYIDVYDLTQAVEDGATVPIFYESRVANLKLSDDVLHAIDARYNDMAAEAEEETIARSKRELGTMEELLGASETIKTIVTDMLKHYNQRKSIVKGKAMIVAYTRNIAVQIYDELIKSPEMKEQVQIIMTVGGKDDKHYDRFKNLADKKNRELLADSFKDADSNFKIAIVVDMWLTGFDVPALDTMYIFKPIAGHNLIQTISRANRVYKDKVGGLIVDYIGIAGALKKAMKDFSKRDEELIQDNTVEKALAIFKEKLELVQSMFSGIEYTDFFDDSFASKKAEILQEMIDHIIFPEEDKKQFINESLQLKKVEVLCRGVISMREREETALFNTVRSCISKTDSSGKLDIHEVNKQIHELLKDVVKSEGIINIFGDATETNLFSKEYLKSIAEMQHKNLAAELLRKLLEDKIKGYERVNIVQAELFSERMQDVLNRYRNRQITNAEVIEELLDISDEVNKADEEGNKLGLTLEEKAFYDALCKPLTKDEARQKFYSDETLIQMTKELTEQLNNSRTIDWEKKDSARAKMRSIIKRLLKKYKYPPEEAPDAIDIVIKQAENWTKYT